MEKIFVKIMTMISIIIIDIVLIPYLIGEPSTLFVILGVLGIMLSLYTEIKICMSFFKEKK